MILSIETRARTRKIIILMAMFSRTRGFSNFFRTQKLIRHANEVYNPLNTYGAREILVMSFFTYLQRVLHTRIFRVREHIE